MEEQGLVVYKDNFLVRLTNKISRFFFKGRIKDLIIEDSGTKLIKGDAMFVQEEILNARRAYRRYVINNNKGISKRILSYVYDEIQKNADKIKQLVDINEEDISYQDILYLLEREKEATSKYKAKDKKTGCYNVPIGVIGVECSNTKDSIANIFKAISTRNAIIILHNNYSKYSTESLVLLIVKECLKNFYIDDNIIQMFEKEEIDLKMLDKLITKDKEKEKKGNDTNTIYIYQEDDEYEDTVMDEVERLNGAEMYKSYNIEPIKGDFADIINYLHGNSSSAVCMYTNNAQRAYKFINWVNSSNVFINTGVRKCDEIVNDCKYYNSKYVLHEDVF